MADAEVFAGDLNVQSPPLTVSRPVIRGRHRDRDYTLRRALVIADMAGLWLALAFSMTVIGSRDNPLLESLWILPILPAWGILFRAYGLYQRPIRRFEPTHLDDVSSLFHALVIGTLGLWLFYKLMPVPQINLDEVLVFGFLALPLIATLRVAVRLVNLRQHGPERVFVIAPIEDVRTLRRKLSQPPRVRDGPGWGGGRERAPPRSWVCR